MDDEQMKKIIEDTYDESKEDTLRSWLRDGYSKRMRWITFGVCAFYIIILVPMIFSIIQFCRSDQTKYQIMYAVIFLFCSHWMGFESVFAWVMMQRPRLHREIKRLEFRIAELIETVKDK